MKTLRIFTLFSSLLILFTACSTGKHTTRIPAYLQPGDSVAIFGTSNSTTSESLVYGVALLESWGLHVRLADNLFLTTDGRYAGTVQQRSTALAELLGNPHIKALIASRGGYGCNHLLPISLKAFKKHPKWVVGYSDVTTLHAVLNNAGYASIHGPMAFELDDSLSTDALRRALFGEYPQLSIPTNPNCVQGSAQGRLVGGNLSVLCSLIGTPADFDPRGTILFIEEIGEYNYHIDRMLTALEQSGKLGRVKGIVIGQLSKSKQFIDLPLEEMVLPRLRALGVPVMYGVSAGHELPNYSLYLGHKVSLEVGADTATLRF